MREGRHRVMVWGESVEVSLHQKSKSVWIARGTYLTHSIETKDRSPGSALARWREAATYRGG